jgi:leucyl aminopeptidase
MQGSEQVKATRRVAHQRVHDDEDAAAALTAGLLQGGYQATALKRSAKPSPLRNVTVFTLGSGGDIDAAVAQAAKVAQGTALARCAALPHRSITCLSHAQQR